MRILLVSDAWEPQVNGVVRTLATTAALLRMRGHAVETITPDRFRSLPCPTYPEIRLALAGRRAVASLIEGFAPDAIHIATEGPLGWRARGWCLRHGVPFTTSFHTRFPDYVAARTGLPESWLWRLVRRFHAPAAHVLTATPRLAAELAERGLRHTLPWSRGVDLVQFSSDVVPDPEIAALPRPVQLSVGRVAVEKNLTAFLDARTPGSKVIVGDGPALPALRARYPQAHFVGSRHGAALAAAYAAADVFVFPSLTDTFGLVMIEALACGVPVAGFPVPGPLDVIGSDGRGTLATRGPRVGVLDEDLERAISRALQLRRSDCAGYARHFSWDACADQFLTALATIGPLRRTREVAHPSPAASGFQGPAWRRRYGGAS
jgi:glycosyltransferase involved in cell wall biosynthesis